LLHQLDLLLPPRLPSSCRPFTLRKHVQAGSNGTAFACARWAIAFHDIVSDPPRTHSRASSPDGCDLTASGRSHDNVRSFPLPVDRPWPKIDERRCANVVVRWPHVARLPHNQENNHPLRTCLSHDVNMTTPTPTRQVATHVIMHACMHASEKGTPREPPTGTLRTHSTHVVDTWLCTRADVNSLRVKLAQERAQPPIQSLNALSKTMACMYVWS
jgi:hypothetical protein